MKKSIILLIIGIMFSAHSQNITNSLNKVYDNSTLAGFAVSVIRNGEVAYQKEFGYSDIKKGKLYNSKTYQPIGSLSKQVLGVATLKAIELNYFDLESEINGILPFSVVNPNFPTDKIRIKHLLTHTSGIVDTDDFYASCYFIQNERKSHLASKYLKDSLGFQFGKMTNLSTLLSSYLNKNGENYHKENFIKQKAGEQYEYSNIASALMGYIIEYSSKMSFEKFTQKYIFEPLEMRNTSWNGIGLNERNRASLYFDRNTPLPKYYLASYPDGALNTTNEDFGKFIVEVLNGIKGNSKILNRNSYQLIQKDILGYIPKKQPKNRHISFLWYWSKNGRNTLYGSDPGLMTMLIIDVKNNSGYFILQNMDYDDSKFQTEIEKSFGEIASELKKIELK